MGTLQWLATQSLGRDGSRKESPEQWRCGQGPECPQFLPIHHPMLCKEAGSFHPDSQAGQLGLSGVLRFSQE